MKIPAEVLIVAHHLGDILDRVVFVGGMTREFLVTDPAVTSRATKDVDVIFDIESVVERAEFNQKLRQLGFREDMSEDAPICRYVLKNAHKGLDVPVDFMPLDPAILGFSNVWYPDAFESASRIESDSGTLRIIDAPHFLATKLEAFHGRGGGEFYHHDMEDIVAVVDGRPELLDELQIAPVDVVQFIAKQMASLLQNRDFMNVLPGHIGYDEVSDQRVPIVVARMQRIAALVNAAVGGVPPRSTHSELLGQTESLELALDQANVLSWETPRSSNIRRFSYEPSQRILTVTFRGSGTYEYYDVPQEVFHAWTQAASYGRYHDRWVKRYRYRRVRS